MPPIRVGIVGLSATSSWAVTAHLPYLKSSPKYQITGVCNSTLASSTAAISAHALSPTTTKPYGSVADLAASPHIDLVVVSTRVDRHYASLKPALEAGKDCFVEWPLASNLQQATELLDLAERKGVRTIVGLQGRFHPAIARIKDLLASNAIGEVLSSHVELATGIATAEAPEHLEYLNLVEYGGNVLTIPFGHLHDSISCVLGEQESVSATLSVQRPDVAIKSANGEVVRTIQRTAADRIATSGLLATGVPSTSLVHGRGPLNDEPGLVWRVEGEKGVLDVRSKHAFSVSMSVAEVEVRVHDLETGEVRFVEVGDDRPGPAGNVGRIYEAFADGEGVPDWKLAVKRHAWVEAVYESDRSGKRVVCS